MAVKVSRFAVEEQSFWPARDIQVEFSNIPAQHAIDPLLLESIGCVTKEIPVLQMQTDVVETNNYQVALIPLPNLVSGLDEKPTDKTNSVFVLPLTWNELLARFRAESHTRPTQRGEEIVTFGAITIKISSMEVRRSGKPVTVTPLEFKLLRYFIDHPKKVVSRDELLNEVWGFENYPCTRTVDSHMWRLRRKLEANPNAPIHFHTVHGIGYKFLP